MGDEVKLITVSEGKGKNEGTLYYNMDFRDLQYNVPQEVMLLYPEPNEGDFKARKSGKNVHFYNFGLAVDGKRVGVFAYDYYKGVSKNKSLVSVLKGFGEGDVLEITKKEGRVQTGEYKGTEFRMWKVEKVGHEDDFDYDALTSPEDDGIIEPDKKKKVSKPKKKSGGLQKKIPEGDVKELSDKQIVKMLDDADYESKPANVKDVRDNVDPVTKENVEKYLKG